MDTDKGYVFLDCVGGNIVFWREGWACRQPVLRVFPLETQDFHLRLLSHEAGFLEFEITLKPTMESRRLRCSHDLRSFRRLDWEMWPALERQGPECE